MFMSGIFSPYYNINYRKPSISGQKKAPEFLPGPVARPGIEPGTS